MKAITIELALNFCSAATVFRWGGRFSTSFVREYMQLIKNYDTE